MNKRDKRGPNKGVLEDIHTFTANIFKGEIFFRKITRTAYLFSTISSSRGTTNCRQTPTLIMVFNP